MRDAAVFVIDGHDIDLYSDAEGAALEIEGYDASALSYFGADGTVYKATVEGPELLAAQQAQRATRRSQGRRWWQRRAKPEPPRD